MSDQAGDKKKHLLLWKHAQARLLFNTQSPPASSELAAKLQAALPADDEMSLAERIRQSAQPSPSSAEIKSFPSVKQKKFTPIAEFIRLAAYSGEDPLLASEGALILESLDGQFRITVAMLNKTDIEITVEALGFAADQFAHTEIGLLSSDPIEQIIATTVLNEDGDGTMYCSYTPLTANALLTPHLVLIDNTPGDI